MEAFVVSLSRVILLNKKIMEQSYVFQADNIAKHFQFRHVQTHFYSTVFEACFKPGNNKSVYRILFIADATRNVKLCVSHLIANQEDFKYM